MTRTCIIGLALCVGFSAVACSGGPKDTSSSNSAWREQTNQVNDATCERTYDCFSAPVLDVLRQMEPRIGHSADECKANFRAANAHATQPCKPGETYEADRADACLQALNTMTCADFTKTPTGPAECSRICSTGGKIVPSCVAPTTPPPAVDMPDGGALPVSQTAKGELTAGETETFTVQLDCTPGYGFRVTVTPEASDLDLAVTYDIAGIHEDNNDWGPGSAESSTLVTGTAIPLPTELKVGVRSVNGATGAYDIEVTPDP